MMDCSLPWYLFVIIGMIFVLQPLILGEEIELLSFMLGLGSIGVGIFLYVFFDLFLFRCSTSQKNTKVGIE